MISARLRLLGVIALGACASDGTGAGEVLVVAQIDIQPPGAGLVVGGTQQLTAIPKTNSGISVPGRQVTWYTSDERIATVSGTGLVTAVALGQANITARVDQITASVPVNVSPKPVATIELQPPTAELLVGHSVQLVVTMRGADGDVLTDRPATFLSDNPAIASVSTTGAVVAVAVGQTVVRARSEGKEGTSTITVAARPAARLGFTTQPSNATAGQAFGPVRVAVQDEIGGTVTGATNQVTLELSDNPGNATLTGPLTVTAVAGIATFANLVLNKAGTGYTLRATSGSLSPAISSPFSITAGPATALGITTQPPGSAQSGVPLTQPPVVQVQDDHGNPVGQAGVQITAVMVGAGATLSGTTTATTNPSGTATFTGLVISGAAGTYQLRFTATGFTPAVSSDILLSSSALSIVTQPPTNATNGALLSQQPVVRIVDGAGTPVPQGGVIVSVALSGTGGVLSGALSVNTDGAGVASFSGLTITGTAGAFRLVFSAPGVASVTSAPIVLGAGAAAQVRVAVQPPASAQSGTPLAPQPEIQVADQSGNPVSTAGISVAASLASGTGTLG
ncbi:MAG TPA: Ig-like domain-containing protein, partial [Gemmatimonadales bacterium]